jgi:hypothetical protein
MQLTRRCIKVSVCQVAIELVAAEKIDIAIKQSGDG